MKSCAMLLLLIWACIGHAGPSIEITNVPPFGSFADLGGRVLNVSPDAYRVAVFIYVPGAGWYSKPYCAPQLTPIQADGSWTADITTGGSDQYATRITALLVSSNYNQPCVQGPPSLPTNVTSQALASATVGRRDTRLRWINFLGYDWWLKSSSTPVGPGPNYFSDSTNNVWLDGQGQLHLRITNRSNHWQCAELVTDRTFGYGQYRFELAADVNGLDRNVVLGLFTWSDDPAYAHREIDIECSRWGDATDPNSAQFVVQPYDIAGHLVRYAVPRGQTNSTHWFSWETNRVSFQSLLGNYAPNPAPANVITNWTYTLDVPQTGDENIRINLWLNNTNGPAVNNEVEVVVRSFEFVPLGPPPPAVLINPRTASAGQIAFTINGQSDRRYQVQRGTNLADWQQLTTILATNSLMDVFDTNAISSTLLYRVVTEP